MKCTICKNEIIVPTKNKQNDNIICIDCSFAEAHNDSLQLRSKGREDIPFISFHSVKNFNEIKQSIQNNRVFICVMDDICNAFAAKNKKGNIIFFTHNHVKEVQSNYVEDIKINILEDIFNKILKKHIDKCYIVHGDIDIDSFYLATNALKINKDVIEDKNVKKHKVNIKYIN